MGPDRAMAETVLGSLPAVEDIDYEFDVFISYHSSDLDAVAHIAAGLKSHGLNVWWDKWNVTPGSVWLTELSKAIYRSRTTAVFLGPGAAGYWQTEEFQLALTTQQKRDNLVIPVILPGSSIDKRP